MSAYESLKLRDILTNTPLITVPLIEAHREKETKNKQISTIHTPLLKQSMNHALMAGITLWQQMRLETEFYELRKIEK